MMTVTPGTRREESQHYHYPSSCYPTKAAAWKQAEHAMTEMNLHYGAAVLDYEIHHEELGSNRGVVWAQLVRKDPPGMLHCSGMISGM